MNFALNNVTTSDGYTTANTLEGLPQSARVNIDVSNNAIYWQLKRVSARAPQGDWEQEVFMIPGSRSLNRTGITGIRVRSAVSGKASQVTVEVITS